MKNKLPKKLINLAGIGKAKRKGLSLKMPANEFEEREVARYALNVDLSFYQILLILSFVDFNHHLSFIHYHSMSILSFFYFSLF